MHFCIKFFNIFKRSHSFTSSSTLTISSKIVARSFPFSPVYTSLIVVPLRITLTEHSYLPESQRNVALRQVINYANKQKDWSIIKEAEVDVSLVRPDYIIEGKVDLITGKDNTVEIVDFKSEQNPDINTDIERIEHYRRQLNIYAYS